MSAFVVDLEHIHVLIHAGLGAGADRDRATWAADPADLSESSLENGLEGSANVLNLPRWRKLTPDSASAVGQILLDANVHSVNFRYSESEPAETYTYAPPRNTRREPVEIIKAVQCLEYQSCEFPEWRESEAARILEAILHGALRKLPGMSDAQWAIGYQSRTLEDDRRAAALARLEAAK